MKTLLQTLLCFVSVAQCLSQMGTYSGRQRTVVKKPVFDQNPIFHPKPLGPNLNHPKPVVKPEVFGVENSAFGQGRLWGDGAELDFNRLLSGGSQFGRPLRSGETINGILLPEHGGTLEVSGITADGRGAVIPGDLPKNVFNDGWQHPWGGNPIPSDYAGQQLIFDRALGQYVYPKKVNADHQVTKETHNTHNMVKASVGTGIGVDPMSHKIAKSSVGNGIGVNPVFHMSAQSAMSGRHIGGIGADRITHNIAKSTSVGTGGIRVNPFNHNIAKQTQFQHNTVKSSNSIGHIVAGKPNYGVGFSAGAVRVDHHGLTSHNIGSSHNLAKAAGVPIGNGFMNQGSHISRKAEAQAGHDFAKASSVHIGTGFVNQGSHISRKAEAQAGHNFAKAAGMNGINIFGQTSGSNFVHDINKAQSSIGQQFGLGHMIRPVGGASVVHNVNKVGAGGATGMGHDRLAAEVGHGLAKNSVANAAGIVDMGSGGAVSMGDPFANQAAARLAQESLHVAQKTVGMASNRGGAFTQPIMHKPAMPKKPVVFPTGYGGRTRRVRSH